MPASISEKTKKVVLAALNLKSLGDVMDREYGVIDRAHDIDRENAVRYASRNRGSIRINTGRFYTLNEHAERVKRVKQLKLPK